MILPLQIDTAELQHLLTMLHKDNEWALPTKTKLRVQVKETLEKHDADKNGVINFQEFLQVVPSISMSETLHTL